MTMSKWPTLGAIRTLLRLSLFCRACVWMGHWAQTAASWITTQIGQILVAWKAFSTFTGAPLYVASVGTSLPEKSGAQAWDGHVFLGAKSHDPLMESG